MDAQTIIRLDASPYQQTSFFYKEKEVAEKYGCRYLFADSKNRYLPWPLSSEYPGPYILISNTHTSFDRLPKELLENTNLLIHGNSGYDNFYCEEVLSWNFPVILGNPIRVPAVTEYILSHLFSRFGVSPHQKAWDKDRKWDRDLLCDQNVLIVGRGLIGEQVAKSLSPLVQKLSFIDPYKLPETATLSELLPHHRIVILTCSLNEKNHHLLGPQELLSMPKHFILINSARGPLIDEGALIDTLKIRPKAFAFLDVFEKEPFEKQFKNLTNIHLTSHIAGVSGNLDQRLLDYIDQVIHTFKKSPNQFEENYHELILRNRIHNGMLI
ncbi:MAG: hypothetical protein K9K67_09430 [Bacteriovoracaceae bacterium]|nr:hypothetical protein [Bacteriovoracaceae bacterium]